MDSDCFHALEPCALFARSWQDLMSELAVFQLPSLFALPIFEWDHDFWVDVGAVARLCRGARCVASRRVPYMGGSHKHSEFIVARYRAVLQSKDGEHQDWSATR
jgi:hypothetical protein